MNAPLRVPTSTRTLLISISFLGFGPISVSLWNIAATSRRALPVVEAPVQHLVDYGPLNLSVRAFDESVERRWYRIDQLQHDLPSPPRPDQRVHRRLHCSVSRHGLASLEDLRYSSRASFPPTSSC